MRDRNPLESVKNIEKFKSIKKSPEVGKSVSNGDLGSIIINSREKADKFVKKSTDWSLYYEKVNWTRVEYKKTDKIKNKDFRKNSFQTETGFKLKPEHKAYEKVLDDIQIWIN